MTMRLTYTNLADTGTLTNSTAATNYPASNIQHPFKTKTWRSTGVTDEWLKWNLGSAQSVTMVAIVNTNLTAAATVYFCGHASDLGNATANWHGTATVDETITVPAAGMTIKYFTGASKQWWFLGVAPAGAGTYVEIGRVFFGAYYQPSRNFAIEYQHSVIDPSTHSKSIGGQRHSDIKDQYTQIGLSFPFITKTQKEEFISAIQAATTAKSVILSLDPTNDLNDLSFYGHFVDGFYFTGAGYNSANGDYHNIGISFEEDL